MVKGARWLLGAAVLAGAAVCFFAGYQTARLGMEPCPFAQTFYASITDIQGSALTVEGLAVNDINFRGRFHFQVEEDTELLWRYEALPLSDLDPGDRISITFTGPVAESDPAGLSDVVRIQLLYDEK